MMTTMGKDGRVRENYLALSFAVYDSLAVP
jgi:hypothetical protein